MPVLLVLLEISVPVEVSWTLFIRGTRSDKREYKSLHLNTVQRTTIRQNCESCKMPLAEFSFVEK